MPHFGVHLVINGRDRADRLAVSCGAEHLYLGMFEEGVVLGIKVMQPISNERRDPIRVIFIEFERKLDIIF